MASEKFIMVSLEDEKSKDLANVISNDTSRRILSYLSEKEASESEIAKSLGLPPSTVNYNVQHLLKSSLIEVKDFYWSDKGNKVNIYTIAKKLIVIAPKGTKVTSAIKNLIPVALICFAAAAVIQFFNEGFFRNQSLAQEVLRAPAKEAAISDTAGGAFIQASATSNFALWFLIGAFSAIIIYLVIYFIMRKK
jgi:DNA-binding transcriptional ArsR family regulator